MVSVSVRIPYNEVGDLRERFPEYIDAAIRSAVRQIERKVREMIPVRKRSWEPQAGHIRQSVRVYADVEQVTLKMHEDAEHYFAGTDPHDIPVGAKGFLAWQPFPGQYVYSRKASKHPGWRGDMALFEQIVQTMRDTLIEELIVLALPYLGGNA